LSRERGNSRKRIKKTGQRKIPAQKTAGSPDNREKAEAATRCEGGKLGNKVGRKQMGRGGKEGEGGLVRQALTPVLVGVKPHHSRSRGVEEITPSQTSYMGYTD